MSFAGVDNLSDIQNHTYNELFQSGGFIVSDEHVLNPAVITAGKFQDVFRCPTKYIIVIRFVQLFNKHFS